jgi:hypothetical protein
MNQLLEGSEFSNDMTLPRESAYAMAAAFSSVVFRGLAAVQIPPAARVRLTELGSALGSTSNTLAEAYDKAYSCLVQSYRAEYIYKNQLISKVVFGRHSPNTATALLEQPLGSSEADLLVVNGTSTVYEIKTDLDGYSRLRTQLDDYSRHVEFVNVLVSGTRASSIEKMVPDHVGIVAWRGRSLSTVRPASSLLDQLDSGVIFKVLRTSEALRAASRHLHYEPDVPRGHLRRRLSELFAGLDAHVAHSIVIEQLRARGASARQLFESSDFPPSLRAAAFGTDLSRVGRERLAERLSQPLAIMVD